MTKLQTNKNKSYFLNYDQVFEKNQNESIIKGIYNGSLLCRNKGETKDKRE